MLISRVLNLKLFYSLVGLLTIKVDDVTAQTSCVISPDLTTLTIRDGLQRNVELHCQCMDDNGIITGTRWFAESTLVPQSDSDRPNSTTDAVPSRLMFSAPFAIADSGTYTCSPNDMFPATPPGDAITLIAANAPAANRSCNIISTSLPTVTTPGGVITDGTQNVILYCICTINNIAVGPTFWYYNDVRVNLTEDDGSGAPYFRNNVPSPLIIPFFVTGNDGTYRCGSEGTVISTPDNAITLISLVPTVSPPGPIQEAMVGSPQLVNCTVSTVSGVESSSVMISWMGPGGEITNDSRVTISPTTSSGNNYTSSLQFTYLMEGDEGTYTCNMRILDASGSQSIELQTLSLPTPTVSVTAPNTQTVGQSLTLQCEVTAVRVPTPTVSVTASDTQTVGQSLTLQCEVTAVRGITSRVDIVWSSGGTELERMNDVSSTTMGNSLVYTNSYTISQLSTTDEGEVIQCEVVINASPLVMASNSITLDVTVPTPTVTISPSGPIQGAMVGSPQVINCRVSTVSGVESSSVMINWMGPGGVITTTNGRVSIGSVTDDGNNMYTKSLQFTYLMEGDEDTYTCNVMILDTSGSQSVELQSLTIPTPTVSVTAPSTQTVGQSLTLQCEVTTVRGITSRVDIVWSSGGTELQRMDDVSSTTMGNSLVYTDSYTILPLSTNDENRTYRCEVMINSSPTVINDDSVTLNVTVPQASVSITQSREGSVSGLSHTLTCTVMVVSGVMGSLVTISLDREDTMLSLSTNSMATDDGLQFTGTITFLSLLEDNGTQYTCSVSVMGFGEADNSDSVIVLVNAPNVTATLTPSEIIGSAEDVAINFTCTATVEEDIMFDEYEFVWMLNDAPVDHSDDSINITTMDMQSTLYISLNDTTPEDSGIYSCLVNLAVNSTDYFTASDTSIVIITEIGPPLAPDVRNVIITTPYSANISWIVRSIVNDTETYTVQYGTDMNTLSRSIVRIGNTDLSTINEMFTVNITGLLPFTKYYYIISANNSVGTTNTTVKTFTTDETAPSIAPRNFRDTTVTATSITFQWDSLTAREANGIVRNSTITCTLGNSSIMITVTSTAGTVSNLAPFTEYSCNIFAFTVLPGPISGPINVTTAQSASNPPVINTITAINSSTVRVNWTRPTIPNGIITMYTVAYVTDSNNGRRSVPYNGEETQSYDITGLSPYQVVTITITATNGGGTSDPSAAVSGRTSEAAPGIVQIASVVSTSNITVNVFWTPPSQPNGVVTGYLVIYSVYQMDDDILSQMLNNTSNTNYSISGLNPGIPYEAVVVAFTSAGKGEENDRTVFFSEELVPSMAPENVTFKQIDATTLNISWIPLTLFEARGFPEYTVNLATIMDTNSRRKRQSSPDFSMTTNNTFVVFDGLSRNTDYSVEVGVRTGVRTGSGSILVEANPINATTRLPANDEDSSSPIGLIIGGSVGGLLAAVVVIVLIIIVICCVYKSKISASEDSYKSTPVAKKMSFNRSSFTRASFSKKKQPSLIGSQDFLGNDHTTFQMDTLMDRDSTIKTVTSKPILLKDFATHVAEMHENNDHGFEIEYESISSDPIGSMEIAKLPKNSIKNRYANIYGYDESRVMLHRNSESESDYINASYIDGYGKPNTYIATQGPLPETVGDFWQMIWDQKVKTVVMLTKLLEGNKPKCAQYWPNKVGESTNPKPSLTVTFVQMQMFADYELKILQVKSSSDPNCVPLKINHFFFTGWPDHGVPRYATSLVSFVKRVRQSRPKNGSPMVVHCSAGVGRTGTFIALDIMLERIPQTHDVNVHECVQNMRTKRTNMVQTKAQYIFIHDALDELITCGETAFNVQNLRVKVSRMSQVTPGTNKTGFQEQFELLQKVSRTVTSNDCSDALLEYNKDMNFSVKAIPFNTKRVCLSTLKIPGSDYINASFIDGYKHRNAYIATQCPLVSTVDSFWRMLWEYKSAVVVTLCSPQHDTENFLQYWPERETNYGNVKVALMSSGNNDGYNFYKFAVSVKQQTPLQVTMLHYTDWPADGVAKDAKALLNLIKEMLEIQRTTRNKAITVVCSDGCARTGTFITITHTLDQIKVEGTLDIFHVLKSSRINRAGLVANLEQYKYCHKVVEEFLDDFDQYSNFK